MTVFSGWSTLLGMSVQNGWVWNPIYLYIYILQNFHYIYKILFLFLYRKGKIQLKVTNNRLRSSVYQSKVSFFYKETKTSFSRSSHPMHLQLVAGALVAEMPRYTVD